jgi:AmpD protein
MTNKADQPTEPTALSIEAGRLLGARQLCSPNFGPRPEGCPVDLLVVHNISLPPGEFGGGYVDDLFCNRLNPAVHPYFRAISALQVSAHLFIDRHGAVTQFVNLLDRAWHAGASHYRGLENCNDFSIGIELEGSDDVPFTEPQYRCLIDVARLLCRTYPLITAQRVVGHSDIAPGRKTDPGPHFDWMRLRSALEQASMGGRDG